MASSISICNLVLSNLGKENINAFSESTAEARACNQFYDYVLLQAYRGRFAGKTQSLAEVTNETDGARSYAYSRAVDFLRVRWLRPNSGNGDANEVRETSDHVTEFVKGPDG